MKYRCLVLDHDDTAVMSTPQINYPAFVRTLSRLRPQLYWTMEQFMSYCFRYGFDGTCREVLHFTDQEMQEEYEDWINEAEHNIPEFHQGVIEILRECKTHGIILAVVSHSEERYIRRDYRVRAGMEPDIVYGYELGKDKRKPSSWPIMDICRRYGLSPCELLVVDDLKAGYDMAVAAGADFAFAGWGCYVEEISRFMRSQAPHYLEEPQDMRDLIGMED